MRSFLHEPSFQIWRLGILQDLIQKTVPVLIKLKKKNFQENGTYFHTLGRVKQSIKLHHTPVFFFFLSKEGLKEKGISNSCFRSLLILMFDCSLDIIRTRGGSIMRCHKGKTRLFCVSVAEPLAPDHGSHPQIVPLGCGSPSGGQNRGKSFFSMLLGNINAFVLLTQHTRSEG